MKKEYRKIRAISKLKRLLNTRLKNDICINIRYQEDHQEDLQ